MTLSNQDRRRMIEDRIERLQSYKRMQPTLADFYQQLIDEERPKLEGMA